MNFVPSAPARAIACGAFIRLAAFGLVASFGLAAPSSSRAQESAPAPLASESGEDLRRTMAIARDRVFPALVNVEVVTRSYWGGRDYKGVGVGSGTIISPDGYVLTNQHVVDNGVKFTCTLADKQDLPATLVGEDPLTDLAVLKIDVTKLRDPSVPLPHAALGDSSKVLVGDHVMAMGSPFSLSRSVTLGIVSNTERVFTEGRGGRGEDMEIESGQRTGLFNVWIQHDALILPGNSGGPLVSLAGEVIGVNARGGASMGFAIPANIARGVADSLIAKGEVERSWFGVSLRPIKDTGFERGVLVNTVVEDSPAAKAGLAAGDLLIRMDGDELTVRFPDQVPPLAKRIADLPVGASSKIAYLRDGTEAETTLVTEKMEKDRGEERAFRGWGITGLEITSHLAREWRLGSRSGALVSGVKQGGPSQVAEPPLDYGDVLVRVGGREVADLKSLVAIYDEVMAADPLPETLVLEFDRRGKKLVTMIEPRPDEDEDPPREVPKAWIGVATQPILDKLAKVMECGAPAGFRVTRVYPGTKAAEAGLRDGDLIVALNGAPVAPSGLQDTGLLEREVRQLDIGAIATLSVMRCQEKIEVPVELERTRLTAQEALREKDRDFELTVRSVTFFDRDERRWDEDVKGVIVESVEGGGWASLGGIAAGDLIQRVHGLEVTGVKGFREIMDKVRHEQPERVVMVVLRGAGTYYQFLEPEWKPEEK